MEALLDYIDTLLKDAEDTLRLNLEKKNYYACYYLVATVVNHIKDAYDKFNYPSAPKNVKFALSKRLRKWTRLENACESLLSCVPT